LADTSDAIASGAKSSALTEQTATADAMAAIAKYFFIIICLHKKLYFQDQLFNIIHNGWEKTTARYILFVNN
jgi:hypothetical protein